MTVESTISRAQYTANGTTGPFAVPFYFLADGDIQVVYTDTGGVDTVLTLTTDYSVSGAGTPSGGSITTTTAYASGLVTVIRSVDFLQETDYVETDAFPAESHERALDRLTMGLQQVGEVTDRAVVGPVSEAGNLTLPAASQRAGRLLEFDSDGDADATAYTSAQVAAMISAGLITGTSGGQVSSMEAVSVGSGVSVVSLSAMTYVPGINGLLVFQDGIFMNSGVDYTETSSTSITLTDPTTTDAEFVFIAGRLVTSGVDSDQIAFTPDVTSPATRTMQDKMREVISLADAAGVDPTGVVDCTTAFNNAIATGKRVHLTAGTYRVSDVTVVDGMDIEGEPGVLLLVGTNGSGAFTVPSGATVYDIRIKDVAISAATGITNARAFKQLDKSEFTAYASFENVETYKELKTAYDGFFIFTRWRGCRDGYSGSAVGGQTHQFISSVPAAFGQTNQSNINTVQDCEVFNNTNTDAAISIAYGTLWRFLGTDFEGGSSTAVLARGVYSLSFDGCWFENLACDNIIIVNTSPAPNPQGSYPVSVKNSHIYCNAANDYLIYGDWALYSEVENITIANVPAAMRLVSSSTMASRVNVFPLSGSYANLNANTQDTRTDLVIQDSEMTSGVVNSPQTGNQNVLPIGPSGLGQANFTAVGISAKSDVASAIGLAGNAIKSTLAGVANALHYSMPAKLVTFLQGRAVTLVIAGYGDATAVADGVKAAIWDSVVPTAANMTSVGTEIDVSSADFQVSYVTVTVGASASSLNVGFYVGGSNVGKFFWLESMALYLGEIKADALTLK